MARRFGNALVSYAVYLGKTFWPERLAAFYPLPVSVPRVESRYRRSPARRRHRSRPPAAPPLTLARGGLALVPRHAGAGDRHSSGGPAGDGRPLHLSAVDRPFSGHGLGGGGAVAAPQNPARRPDDGGGCRPRHPGGALPGAGRHLEEQPDPFQPRRRGDRGQLPGASQPGRGDGARRRRRGRHAGVSQGSGDSAEHDRGAGRARQRPCTSRANPPRRSLTCAGPFSSGPTAPDSARPSRSPWRTWGAATKPSSSSAKALELSPRFTDAHYGLGSLLQKQGKTGEALEHYQKALEINPDLDELYSPTATLLAARGDLLGAVRLFAESVQRRPDSPLAAYNLAVTLERLGRIDDARTYYARALELDPNLAAARQRLMMTGGVPVR